MYYMSIVHFVLIFPRVCLKSSVDWIILKIIDTDETRMRLFIFHLFQLFFSYSEFQFFNFLYYSFDFEWILIFNFFVNGTQINTINRILIAPYVTILCIYVTTEREMSLITKKTGLSSWVPNCRSRRVIDKFRSSCTLWATTAMFCLAQRIQRNLDNQKIW